MLEAIAATRNGMNPAEIVNAGGNQGHCGAGHEFGGVLARTHRECLRSLEVDATVAANQAGRGVADMILGEAALERAQGATLAHTVWLVRKTLENCLKLSADDIVDIVGAGSNTGIRSRSRPPRQADARCIRSVLCGLRRCSGRGSHRLGG